MWLVTTGPCRFRVSVNLYAVESTQIGILYRFLCQSGPDKHEADPDFSL